MHGLIRRSSTFNTGRIDHLYQDPHDRNARLLLHYGDLTDSSRLVTLIDQIQPDEVYHLAAQSHVRVSFDEPEYTGNTTGLAPPGCSRRSAWSGAVPVLPGVELGDVRRDPAAAGRGHPVLPALPVWGGEGLRVLDDAELPRGPRAVRGERDPVQPRVPAPRGDVRDPQDHPGGGPDRRRASRSTCISATSTRSGTGAMPRSTSRRCGGCCRPTSRTTTCSPPGRVHGPRFLAVRFEHVGLDWEHHVRSTSATCARPRSTP